MLKLATVIIAMTVVGPLHAQAWQSCVQGSIAPGGCDSIAPGGGRSIAPGGGMSIAPGGGRSIAPGGGLSIAPGGGMSLAPGGGQWMGRDQTRGFTSEQLQQMAEDPNYEPQ